MRMNIGMGIDGAELRRGFDCMESFFVCRLVLSMSGMGKRRQSNYSWINVVSHTIYLNTSRLKKKTLDTYSVNRNLSFSHMSDNNLIKVVSCWFLGVLGLSGHSAGHTRW